MPLLGFASRLLQWPLVLVLIIPLIPVSTALAVPGTGNVPNPGTDLWNEVRQREVPLQGTTQVQGMDTGVLINADGERWRLFRLDEMVPGVGLVLAAVLGLILVYHLIFRGVPLSEGRSGKALLRFSEFDRVLHWTLASLFIFLALTGLILFAGRFVLVPVIGHEAFSVVASASKEGHNLFGPMFIVALLVLFVRFVGKNFPGRGDLGWIFRAGGLFGGKHPSAGFFNAGEKIWFWAVTVIGLAISVTGLILEFPFFGQDRSLMALSLVIHGVGAALLIAGMFGHIYVGTAGMEGSIDSMTKGYVDLNWARQHHDHWAEKAEAAGEVVTAQEVQTALGRGESLKDVRPVAGETS